jgi:hypothetical protein
MCDVTKEEIFQLVSDPNTVLMTLFNVNMAKMGEFMGSKKSEDVQFTVLGPLRIAVNPPGPGPPPPPADAPLPTMFATMEVKNFDHWYVGWQAHATSKTSTWGYELLGLSSDFCEESPTQVFRSTKNSNRVAVI